MKKKVCGAIAIVRECRKKALKIAISVNDMVEEL